MNPYSISNKSNIASLYYASLQNINNYANNPFNKRMGNVFENGIGLVIQNNNNSQIPEKQGQKISFFA